MCGITGIFNFNRHVHVSADTLASMNRRLLHRGPDEGGSFVDANFGFAMRRLSILDVQCGHQPATNEDGRIVIVYNGEIYNHQELRAELQARGHKYRTRSDTETIVHLYEEYGRDLVHRLRGMFAFAIWDKQTRRLLVARDRLGIKPFYYWLTRDQFVFGSEIKAILEHPSATAKLNPSTIPEYLAFGYIAGPETMFDGIFKLPPGHTLEVGETGNAEIRQYWDVPPAVDEDRPERYYVEKYRAMLEDAVSSHLLSDVPLGMFLSGGLDSSTIAAIMKRCRREAVETFSVGYEENEYSELAYARSVAQHIGSVHHEVRVSRQEFFESLPKLIWHEDEPLMGSASVPLYFVSRLARERVKVVLTGEGSDETLAGYSRYAWTLANARWGRHYSRYIPEGIRKRIRQALQDGSIGTASMRRKLMHTFVGLDSNDWQQFYFDNFYSVFSAREQSSLLSPELQEYLALTYRSSLEFFESRSGDLLDRMLYTDVKTYLVELLRKQDTMSMAASVESRVPFLDHALVEFASTIPAKFKIERLAGKSVLKKAVADLLPRSIVYRKKMGFPTPFAQWMDGPQLEPVERMLLGPRTLGRDLFKKEAVRRLFTEHRSGMRNNSERFWRLLNLEMWHRVCVERDPEPANPMLEDREVPATATLA